MTSRLDRLFLLLENGGSEATRHAAALQLGEVVLHHPYELDTLLNRLLSFITSKTWETRIAAGHAVNAIISNIPIWDPRPTKETNIDFGKEAVGHLSLGSFNIRRVLENGSYLLGGDERQFELDNENDNIDPREKATRQRLLVNQRLGLDIANALGINTQEIFSNADLTNDVSECNTSINKNSVVQIVQNEMACAGLNMSSRELNRAKRKAKFLNKQKSCEATDKSCEEGPEKKRFKSCHDDSPESDGDDQNRLKIADDRLHEQDGYWPLEEFADNLSRDLFSCSWEARHGAATALREVIRIQGKGAGKTAYQTSAEMEASHLSWLEDKAVRLVCVLALDRFGDFLADQVVAPVRETCAQTLGCALQYMPQNSILAIASLLQDMLLWDEWGTRHGGLLGLKYLLAVREDMRRALIDKTYTFIFKGLRDEMDDVVAVAATCLVPVAEDLVEVLPPQEINELINTLWEALLDTDDLTASTNSILMLIAKLLSYSKILRNFNGDLSKLIPRLWIFLYHSNCTIRTTTLKTLETLLNSLSENLDENKGIILKEEMESKELNDIDQPINGSTIIEQFKNNIKEEALEKKLRWLEITLEPLLTHTYQRSLLEHCRENITLLLKIWDVALKNVALSSLLLVSCRLISTWLCLMMTNGKTPIDSNLMMLASHPKKEVQNDTDSHKALGESVDKSDVKFYIGGPRDVGDNAELLEEKLVMARCAAASLIGNLSHYVSQPMPGVEYQPDETPILCYVRLVVSHLNSRSGIQRYGAGLVAREWALQHPQTLCHSLLKASLLNCLQETIYYDEIAWMFTRLQQEAKDFLTTLKLYKVSVDPALISAPFINLDQIQKLCETSSWCSVKLRKNIVEMLESRRKSIMKNFAQTSADQIKLNVTIQSVIAGALVRFKCLPEKLNPVIKPLMESIKNESNEQQQSMAALDLTYLLELCIDREPSPNAKILKNLASFLCVDEEYTPNILNSNSRDLCSGILSLLKQEKIGNTGCQRISSGSGRGPGRPPLKSVPSTSSDSGEFSLPLSNEEEVKKIQKQNTIQRRGCTMALVSITSHFGSMLGSSLPHFQNMIFEPLEAPQSPRESNLEAKQSIIHWLQLLEVIIPVLHSSFINEFESHLESFDVWLFHSYAGIRHMAGRVFASLASVSKNIVVCYLIEHVLPNLNMSNANPQRMGAMECIYLTIEKLGFNVIPYIVLLIIPLLGSMSDVVESLRRLGTLCFATLIRLFPLDGGSNLPVGINSSLASQITKERVFLDRLLEPQKIEDYKVPIHINAELRSYQQKGINWLFFLREFNLHGILCDDMGLGKTLQSICILASDHHEKEALYLKNKDKSSKAPCKTGYQSLVVCPPTLTGHWYYEITKFVSKQHLNPLHYTGQTNERKRLRNYFANYNLIIASYKIVRNEIDFFSKVKWNYIVLDEGHTIKNAKTKSSKAIKELTGSHRLILTGTPIQNNVLELWSLFDFLMPGYLGTEKQFISKYSKPIVQSKEAKSSSKEQEAGVFALESLHRQVLPFILRRVKDDVLKDLPPKITQDYFCELSSLQERLYEDFAKSHSSSNAEGLPSEEKGKNPHGHIFQALQYLRRVCNHPKLVLSPSHPQFEAINRDIHEKKTPLSDISHAAKLPALKQLLLDCGIGSTSDDPSMSSSSILSPHRALIFCQLKGMLDIIEKDLLRIHLPSVSYLRLDGSVPAGNRHSLVHKFNFDPSIDLLLLTTQVGGLGLNLTGADTVIFVEHDWNPMRDLQAMDRAHRIGQKRVVNVYRLITKGTLEEKIMSLQKFKLMTANSIISPENSSLLSMGTDQLLDLFTLDSKGQPSSGVNLQSMCSSNEPQTLGLRTPGLKKALDNLPELWEEGLYEEEYNLDSFLKTLKEK